MARTLKNRVKETTATTGTGDITPSGAVARFRTFASSGLATNATIPYVIEVPSGAWEVGLGTWTAAGKIQRTTVEDSSTGSVLSLTGEAGTTIALSASAAALTELSTLVTGLPAVTAGNTVTTFAQADLIPVYQSGTVNYVSTQNLVGGKTIDQLGAGTTVTTTTVFPAVQGSSTSVGISGAQLATFGLAQQVNYRRPKIEVSGGSLALDTTNANAAIVFTAPGTLSFAAIGNLVTAGFVYEAVVIADGGAVSFGTGITVTGANPLASGQTAIVRGYTRADGAVRVIASTPSTGGGTVTPAATIAVSSVTGLTAGGTTTVSGTFANGTPTGLTYSLDGGAAVTASSPTIGSGTYSFTMNTPAAGTHTIAVTGTGGNTASSSPATSFTTTAAASPGTLTQVANGKTYILSGLPASIPGGGAGSYFGRNVTLTILDGGGNEVSVGTGAFNLSGAAPSGDVFITAYINTDAAVSAASGRTFDFPTTDVRGTSPGPVTFTLRLASGGATVVVWSQTIPFTGG